MEGLALKKEGVDFQVNLDTLKICENGNMADPKVKTAAMLKVSYLICCCFWRIEYQVEPGPFLKLPVLMGVLGGSVMYSRMRTITKEKSRISASLAFTALSLVLLQALACFSNIPNATYV